MAFAATACLRPAGTPFVDGFLARADPGREAAVFAKLSGQPHGTASEIALLALYLVLMRKLHHGSRHAH